MNILLYIIYILLYAIEGKEKNIVMWYPGKKNIIIDLSNKIIE